MYFFEIHELGRHYAACRVFGIIEVLIYKPSGFRRCSAHDTLHDVCRQLLHHVNGVVNVKLFDDRRQLRVCDGVYYLLLLGRIEVCKNVRCHLL